MNKDAMIEMLDEAGKKIYIPRSEYIKTILPDMIQQHWDKPDELASTIMMALNDEFYAQLEDAAKRLMDIDTIPDRAVCLYGAVLFNTHRCAEAEILFLDYLNHHSRHPYVLANLAKAQVGLDKKTEALITLEESLMADPNQDNALTWWLEIRIEQLASEGLTHEPPNLAAYKELNKRFGGWIAKAWLGEYYIVNNNIDTARTYYEEILAQAYAPHVLTRISSDLGQYGFFDEALELIVPRYIPEQHDIETGLNLLQVYLELKQVSEGQQLLHELYALNRLDVAEHLDGYKIKFLNLEQPIAQLSEENLKIKFEFIHYPLWCYGWNIKHGFDTSQSGKKIAIVQFSCQSEASEKSSAPLVRDLEDTEGRLARAIPLYLLEAIYYGTNASSSVIFPVSEGKTEAYVLYSAPPSRTQILALADQGYDGVVTGVITSNKLKMTYWDLAADTEAHETLPFDFNQPENTLSHLETFVFEHADIKFDAGFQKHKRGFQAIPEQHQQHYLMLSSQHLTLHRAAQQADTMISEHHLIQGLLKLAKHTETMQMQLNLISAIHLCMRYQSPAIKDYKGRITRWLDGIAESEHILHGIAEKTAKVFRTYCADE
jgi:tetratricopeptide (TPR) repeat protein